MLSETEIEKVVSEKILSITGKRITSAQEELVASGVLTSITMAELAVELEKDLSVHFSFMEVNKENFSSVDAVVKLVQKKKQDVL